MEGNGNQTLLLFLLSAILLIAWGILSIKFPRVIRKYDVRMTRFIPDEEEYVYTTRFWGGVCLIVAALILIGVAISYFLVR